MSDAVLSSVAGFLGGKNLPLTRRLLKVQQHALGIQLLAVARACQGDELDGVFQPLYAELRSLPPDAFWPVWFMPAAGFWAHLSSEMLQSRFSGSSPTLLGHYARWRGRNSGELAFDHFKQLGVFVVAAHLRRGTAYSLPVAVPLDEAGSFPGAGVSWENAGLELLGCTADGAIRLREGEVERLATVSETADRATPFFRTPCVRQRGNLWVDVWSSWMRADHEGMERCRRATGYAAAAAAVERLAAAIERVEAYSLGLAVELAEVVSSVAPLQSPHDDVYPSGTCSICPRAIFITVAEEPDILAELLIHECGHDKLYLLQGEDPLLDPSVPGNGWDDALYYSPWKDAPRSLQGILHAAFVFTEVAGFWQWRLEHAAGDSTRCMAARRLKTLCEQLRLAEETLETFGSFTPIGQEVLDELRTRLDALSDAARTIDGDRTEVMHVLYASAPYCGLSVNEAVRRHRADHGPKALS